ncbi:MAG: MBL fold metallo-hydrolase [Deltaproteobacteria bacterium]|nr:MBL fold metallo-hydrolase [Deltaproteobacteria bacterium]
MKVRFLNPIEQVTGSCYWLQHEAQDIEFLVDCGMMQGEHGERDWNHRPLEFVPSRLKCVFLTHAHLDHCGLLPRLVKEGFRGKVYCTRETAALAKLILADAARQPGAPFSSADVEALAPLFHEPSGRLFGELHPFGTDLFFTFCRTGHILGAVSVQIVWGPKPTVRGQRTQRSITFSGDLGTNAEGDEHLGLLRHRMKPAFADYAVVESTYGATSRPPEQRSRAARVERLREIVDRTLFEQRGILLIPCLAVDRTQSVLLDLHEVFRSDPARYRGIPMYLNAPMAAKANGIYAEGMCRKELSLKNSLKPVWRAKQLASVLGLPDTAEGERELEARLTSLLRGKLGAAGFSVHDKPIAQVIEGGAPAVVITGSGMCEGGMVMAYLDALLRRESTTLLFTSFVAPATNGGRLLQHVQIPTEDRCRVSDQLTWADADPKRPVHRLPLSEMVARIEKIDGYSAHADQHDLLDWLIWEHNGRHCLAGKTVFITHGTDNARRELAQAVQTRGATVGVSVEVPTKKHGWYDLDKGCWLEGHRSREAELEARVAELERLLAERAATA